MNNWFKKQKKYSDKEIIQILQNGSRKEVAAMHQHLLSIVFSKICNARKAIAILNNKTLREEAFHEAYTVFIHKINTNNFKGESNLSTFFTKIFLDKCVDVLRKINTNKYIANRPGPVEMEEQIQNLPQQSQDILHDLFIKTDMEMVYQTLKDMNNNCEAIIRLNIQGYRHAEIAKILHLKPATVKTRNTQCKNALIKQLKGKLY